MCTFGQQRATALIGQQLIKRLTFCGHRLACKFGTQLRGYVALVSAILHVGDLSVLIAIGCNQDHATLTNRAFEQEFHLSPLAPAYYSRRFLLRESLRQRNTLRIPAHALSHLLAATVALIHSLLRLRHCR